MAVRYHKECRDTCERFGNCAGAGYRPVSDKSTCDWVLPKDVEDSITCPTCKMTSYNPYDIKYEYCGNCHQYHDILRRVKFLEK